jgi:hypothetical protein
MNEDGFDTLYDRMQDRTLHNKRSIINDPEFFTLKVAEGRSISRWDMLCELADKVESEVKGSGALYALPEKLREQYHYPNIFTLRRAAEDLRAFQQFMEFIGNSNGSLTQTQIYSPYRAYASLELGDSSINTLGKSLFIVKKYFSTQHKMEKLVRFVNVLDNFFTASGNFAEEIGYDTSTSRFTQLKDYIYFSQKSIMERKPGKLKFQHLNRNGRVEFYWDGTVKVVIDNLEKDARSGYGINENLYVDFDCAMRKVHIVTNTGSRNVGIANTYTIPAGANLPTVLGGLYTAQFITDNEIEHLRKKIAQGSDVSQIDSEGDFEDIWTRQVLLRIAKMFSLGRQEQHVIDILRKNQNELETIKTIVQQAYKTAEQDGEISSENVLKIARTKVKSSSSLHKELIPLKDSLVVEFSPELKMISFLHHLYARDDKGMLISGFDQLNLLPDVTIFPGKGNGWRFQGSDSETPVFGFNIPHSGVTLTIAAQKQGEKITAEIKVYLSADYYALRPQELSPGEPMKPWWDN